MSKSGLTKATFLPPMLVSCATSDVEGCILRDFIAVEEVVASRRRDVLQYIQKATSLVRCRELKIDLKVLEEDRYFLALVSPGCCTCGFGLEVHGFVCFGEAEDECDASRRVYDEAKLSVGTIEEEGCMDSGLLLLANGEGPEHPEN